MHSAVQYRFFGKGLLNNVILWVQGLDSISLRFHKKWFSTIGKYLYDNCFDFTCYHEETCTEQFLSSIID